MRDICYKGFNKGMMCKGKQYTEKTIFEGGEVIVCERGMHYCKNPFDVLDYYGFINGKGELNEFAEVEPLDEEKTDDNKKFCTKKLRVGVKLGLKGFIKACVDFAVEKTTFEFPGEVSSGDSAQIGSSGNYAQINSGGEHSVVMCVGNKSIAKAKKGSWITLAEWRYSEEYSYFIPICVKTEQVDGERIKADTWYSLDNGEFIEVQGVE